MCCTRFSTFFMLPTQFSIIVFCALLLAIKVCNWNGSVFVCSSRKCIQMFEYFSAGNSSNEHTHTNKRKKKTTSRWRMNEPASKQFYWWNAAVIRNHNCIWFYIFCKTIRDCVCPTFRMFPVEFGIAKENTPIEMLRFNWIIVLLR